MSRSLANGDDKGQAELKDRAKSTKARIAIIEEELSSLLARLNGMLLELPNLLMDEVPDGDSEEENITLSIHGSVRDFGFDVLPHFDVSDQMDFVDTANMCGSRFVTLRRELAKLHRSLANFMLDTHVSKFGYEEILPPSLVKEHTMLITGQLPKFADDSFVTRDGYRLIPTSEIPLNAIVADRILDGAKLPLRFTAFTPCFRREAGSAGKDTRGIIRMHEFYKVELVSIILPEESEKEHERMTEAAEYILSALELPYRRVLLCAGDTGFCSAKTYDIEVWMPSQNKYREISSCSNCIDFQARRMNTRYKSGKMKGFVHTLNGSGVAVPRAMAAILENYQNSDGSVSVPQVLQAYVGKDTILSTR